MISRGKKIRVLIFLLFAGWILAGSASGQPVPGKDENIDFLVTFGKEGKTSWGDFYFRQIFFFYVPKDLKEQFYIRVFDPDCGGENDEIQGEFNSKTMFSVYGGKGVDPEQEANKESMGLEKTDNYKRGNLLFSQVFGTEARYDNKYYTFGPLNPTEGDPNEKWGYIFKVVCEGVAGDDGNLYRYFLSRDPDNNIAVEGGNAFTYAYTFRMWNNFQSVAHIYPYVDQNVVLIKMKNFDWDNDGRILVVSRYRQGSEVKEISNEDVWKESQIIIANEEKNSSIDFQFHKAQAALVKNNNVVITIQNQYDQALKFFSSPIGGVPVYNGEGAKKAKPPSNKPGTKPPKK